MKISAINSISFRKTNTQKKSLELNSQNINQTEQNNCNLFYKPTFGKRIYEDFNVEKLPNIGLEQEFSRTELVPLTGSVDLMSLLGLTSYLAEPIRYYDKHGELIHYKKREVLDECKYKGLNEEETQQRLEQAKIDFINEIQRQKEDAIASINSLSPTEKAHTVYRVISSGWTQDSKDYFDMIKTLKKGQEITLDSTPIYVSTSAKKTIGNYGGNRDYILFEINLPKGSKLLRFPSSDGIEQCIMKPEAKFRVVDNEEYNNNFHYITLDYLPTEEG